LEKFKIIWKENEVIKSFMENKIKPIIDQYLSKFISLQLLCGKKNLKTNLLNKIEKIQEET